LVTNPTMSITMLSMMNSPNATAAPMIDHLDPITLGPPHPMFWRNESRIINPQPDICVAVWTALRRLLLNE